MAHIGIPNVASLASLVLRFTVIRTWFDRHALSQAMGLEAGHQLLLAQTVGHRG